MEKEWYQEKTSTESVSGSSISVAKGILVLSFIHKLAYTPFRIRASLLHKLRISILELEAINSCINRNNDNYSMIEQTTIQFLVTYYPANGNILVTPKCGCILVFKGVVYYDITTVK